MLWLKAWMETRWRVGWAFLIGLLFFTMPLMSTPRGIPPGAKQMRFAILLFLVAQASFMATFMLAGSGIHTGSTRPGASDKGAERSMLFTLSLPVTRARLFLVRTSAGMLEIATFLTILFAALWMIWPQPMTNPHDAFGYFALVASCSLAAYALSACLSTFLDEGTRIRASVFAFIVPSVFIFRGGRSPITNIFASTLTTHRVQWITIGVASILTLLFLSVAITIIQRRDY